MGNSISSPAIEHRDMALQVLTYCDITDMMQLKRKCISMDSNLVVDIAVAQKCPVSKVFMSNDELYAAVSLFNEIHYQHKFHKKYHGVKGRLLLRKAAEFIAVKYGWNISLWDVSHITSFRCLFCDCHDFNLPIGNWDTSSVISMEGCFAGACSFNQDISGWNVSSVMDMSYMFYDTSYNKFLGRWNVANVTKFCGMFQNCEPFCEDPWLRHDLVTNWRHRQDADAEEMFSPNPAVQIYEFIRPRNIGTIIREHLSLNQHTDTGFPVEFLAFFHHSDSDSDSDSGID